MDVIKIEKTEYMKDSAGRLIPVANIKDIDKLRDELVLDIVKKCYDAQAHLAALKMQVLDDISAFVSLSAEKYGVKVGGAKGNLSLYSFDGHYKIVYSIAQNLRFDERIHAAKALIDECISDWTADSRNEIKALIDNAFAIDKEGNLSTARILGLRRVKIEDRRWISAMEAISDSIQIIGSTAYVRIYERQQDADYKQIRMDFSGV